MHNFLTFFKLLIASLFIGTFLLGCSNGVISVEDHRYGFYAPFDCVEELGRPAFQIDEPVVVTIPANEVEAPLNDVLDYWAPQGATRVTTYHPPVATAETTFATAATRDGTGNLINCANFQIMPLGTPVFPEDCTTTIDGGSLNAPDMTKSVDWTLPTATVENGLVGNVSAMPSIRFEGSFVFSRTTAGRTNTNFPVGRSVIRYKATNSYTLTYYDNQFEREIEENIRVISPEVCTVTVEISLVDNTPPVLDCPTTEEDSPLVIPIPIDDGDILTLSNRNTGASAIDDGPGIATITYSPDRVSLGDTTNIIATATDNAASPNQATCEFTIYTIPTQPLLAGANCGTTVSRPLLTGSNEAMVPWVIPTMTMPDGSALPTTTTLSAVITNAPTDENGNTPPSITAGAVMTTSNLPFPEGEFTITYTANTVPTNPDPPTCVVTIMVNPVGTPALVCPESITVTLLEDPTIMATWTGPTLDPVDMTTFRGPTSALGSNLRRDGNNHGTSQHSGTFPLGTNLVVYTATSDIDTALVATCSFNVVVEDKTPPVLTCPVNVVASLHADQIIIGRENTEDVRLPTPDVSDNSGQVSSVIASVPRNSAILTVDDVLTSPGRGRFILNAAPVTVTYTASDESGNEATCTFTVRVTQRSFLFYIENANQPNSLDNPFHIENAEDIILLARVVNTPVDTYVINGVTNNYNSADYLLVNDIDYSGNGNNFVPIGQQLSFTDANAFRGTFNGNSNTISGLRFTGPTSDNVGLFGVIQGTSGDDMATVSNLMLTDVRIIGHGRVGAVSGRVNRSAMISNVYVSGHVEGSDFYIGGVTGLLYGGSWESRIGFELGFFRNGVRHLPYAIEEGARSFIHNAFNAATVTGTEKAARVGGIVGHMAIDAYELSNVASIGNVTAYEAVGGIAGYVDGLGRIVNSYSGSKVLAKRGLDDPYSFAGGIVGEVEWKNFSSEVEVRNSIAWGRVTASQVSPGVPTHLNIGGLIAGWYRFPVYRVAYAPHIHQSWYDRQAHADGTGTGVYHSWGLNITSSGGQDRDVLQRNIARQSHYGNWSGVIWDFGGPHQYPVLKTLLISVECQRYPQRSGCPE